MARQKVCVLSSAHPAFDIRIYEKECTALANAGYDVTLIVPHESSEERRGIWIRALPKPRSRSERLFSTVFQLARVAWSERADLYHFHDPELLPIMAFFRLCGRKVVFDMHENTPKAFLTKPYVSPWLRPLASKFYAFFERMFIGSSPVVFAEDSYVREYPWVERKVTVRNMPKTSSLLKVEEKKFEKFTLVYSGGVSSERGSFQTLAAMRHIQQELHREIQWKCVGLISDEHQKELNLRAQEQSIADVDIMGYIRAWDAWKLTAQCHVGLALLDPIPNYLESYPTKMFEYMALGLPIVASNFPLYRRILGEEDEACGLLVDPHDEQAIIEAVTWLMDNPEEAAAMGQRGQAKTREEYNWKLEEEKLVGLYHEMLGKPVDDSGVHAARA